MNKYSKNAMKYVEWLNKLTEAFCNLLLVVMILIVVLQVLCRYFLNAPISWSEEVALLMLIWFGMLSVSTAVYRNSHMSISFFWDRLSIGGKYFLDVAVQLLILVFSLNIMFNANILMNLVESQVLPASGILREYLYLAPLVAGTLMGINAIHNILFAQNINEDGDAHNLVTEIAVAENAAIESSVAKNSLEIHK